VPRRPDLAACATIASLIDRSWAGRGYVSRTTWSRSVGMWVSWPMSMKTPPLGQVRERSTTLSDPQRGVQRNGLPHAVDVSGGQGILAEQGGGEVGALDLEPSFAWRAGAQSEVVQDAGGEEKPSSQAASAMLPRVLRGAERPESSGCLGQRSMRSQLCVPGRRTPGWLIPFQQAERRYAEIGSSDNASRCTRRAIMWATTCRTRIVRSSPIGWRTIYVRRICSLSRCLCNSACNFCLRT